MCAPLYHNRRVVVGVILSHVSATGQSSLGPVRPWKGKTLRRVGADAFQVSVILPRTADSTQPSRHSNAQSPFVPVLTPIEWCELGKQTLD